MLSILLQLPGVCGACTPPLSHRPFAGPHTESLSWCKVLLPVSSLIVHKMYCTTLGNVARVYPWIVQGLTFLSA